MPKGGKGRDMPEPNMADTIEEQAAVDSAATMEEIPSAEESSPKTFTAEEVDAKIKARIDKQNAKHAEELAEISQRLKELEERSAAAETERDQLKKQQEIAELAATVADEFGVPAYMLHGETHEELTKSAEAAASFKKEIIGSLGTAPVIKDSGQPSGKRIKPNDKAAFVKELFRND